MQCVEHMVEFKMNNEDIDGGSFEVEPYKINARDFFVPTQVTLFICLSKGYILWDVN